MRKRRSTFTAKDTTDSTLTPAFTPTFSFVTPPAASASIGTGVPTDRQQRRRNRRPPSPSRLRTRWAGPSPGKLVHIFTDRRNSVISGPNPQVTDSNGNIEFTATDLEDETVTYTAVDVTDGNLPVPGRCHFRFHRQSRATPAAAVPPAAPGFRHALCHRVLGPVLLRWRRPSISAVRARTGMAFDSSGNLYVNELLRGTSTSSRPAAVSRAHYAAQQHLLGVTLAGLAFDSSGDLFASLDPTSADCTTGAVIQLDPSNGTVIRRFPPDCRVRRQFRSIRSAEISSPMTLVRRGSRQYLGLARFQSRGASPSTSVYTTLPNTPNATLAFAPGGDDLRVDLYRLRGERRQGHRHQRPTPTTVNVLPDSAHYLGLLAGGSGEGTIPDRDVLRDTDANRSDYRPCRPDDQSAELGDLIAKVGRQLPDLRP